MDIYFYIRLMSSGSLKHPHRFLLPRKNSFMSFIAEWNMFYKEASKADNIYVQELKREFQRNFAIVLCCFVSFMNWISKRSLM